MIKVVGPDPYVETLMANLFLDDKIDGDFTIIVIHIVWVTIDNQWDSNLFKIRFFFILFTFILHAEIDSKKAKGMHQELCTAEKRGALSESV